MNDESNFFLANTLTITLKRFLLPASQTPTPRSQLGLLTNISQKAQKPVSLVRGTLVKTTLPLNRALLL